MVKYHADKNAARREGNLKMAEYKPENIEGGYIIYKGKPLVRHQGFSVYGDLSEKYALYLIVVNTKKIKIGDVEEDVPDNVIVQIMSTDESKPTTERLVKQSMESGLYNALDIGIEWLNRQNKQ